MSKETMRSIIVVQALVLASMFVLLFFVFDSVEDMRSEVRTLNKNVSLLYRQVKRMEMYDDQTISDGMINGLYRHNKYYCVWTKDRSPKNILRTECHEQLHTIIHQDNESTQHFCGAYT